MGPTDKVSQVLLNLAQQWVEGNLVVAIPSGKNLEEATLEMFRKAHIKAQRMHPRILVDAMEGLSKFTVAAFCTPTEIPGMVARGTAAIGITGMDTVREFDDTGNMLEVCAEFAYGRTTNGPTRCVLFANEDDPAQTIDDIRGEFGGRAVPIITEYPVETRRFLEGNDLCCTIFPARGSAETLVRLRDRDCRFGVALTETGATLKMNRQRVVAILFESSTALIANKELLEMPAARCAVEFIGKMLQGVLDARGKVYLVMNAPATSVGDICRILPSLRAPTIQPLHDATFCSISAVVPMEQLTHLKFCLAEYGAEGFIELDASSVM